MGLKDMTIAVALVFIFSISLINYAVTFAEDNNANITIGDDPDIQSIRDYSDSNTEQYIIDSNGSVAAFQESTITGESETTTTGSFFKAISASKTVGGFKNILDVSFRAIFGGDARFNPVIGIIGSTLFIIFALFVWKVWKGGNPD